jgi:hypothetical protein
VFFVVFVVGAFVAAFVGNEGGGNEAQKNKKGGGGKDTAPKPELVVSSPAGSPTVTKDSIEVKGEVTPATSKVTVNGEGVTPADDGSFSTPLHLNVGENYIQISAERAQSKPMLLGRLHESYLRKRPPLRRHLRYRRTSNSLKLRRRQHHRPSTVWARRRRWRTSRGGCLTPTSRIS